MKVALFIPCFIDTLYPRVGVATYKILKKLGFEVVYPPNQTCCGQPFFNSGFKSEAKKLAKKFFNEFNEYDYIVAPSASCISMVKVHYKELLEENEFNKISSKSYEICEFLHDVVKLDSLDVSFNHSIALHQSCHGLRELELATDKNLNIPYQNKVENLLKLVKGIEIKSLPNAQECCGFGGTFSVNYNEISKKMGQDKIKNFLKTGAEFLVGYDNSCLMHLSSINSNIKILHVVEILSGVANETL